MHRMSRGSALTLVAILIMSSLFGLIGVGSKNASATSLTFTPTNTNSDGDHEIQGFTYPPNGSTYNFTHAGYMGIGQAYTVMAGNYSARSFVKFNTSAIPNNAIITSAVLTARVRSDSSTVDFDLHIWMSTNWGTTIPLTQFWNMSSYQGTMFNTGGIAVGTRYSMGVDPAHVNLVGNTTYGFKSSRDGVNPPTPGVAESIFLYDTSQGDTCTLIISYSLPGAAVSIELDSGAWRNSTAYPEISEWNLTYDIYYFAVDTLPSSKNVTIAKSTTWIFQGLAPGCNYTDAPTFFRLEDVSDLVCYRVWFTVPKVSPYATVHISLYNTFTGEGFFWEQMHVQMCDGSIWDNTTAQDLSKPDFNVDLGKTYTLRVLDFFGNVLVDSVFVSNANDVFVTISVPLYSWQVFNENDQAVLVRILWNHTGAPWEFFVAPGFPIERFLKGGDYTFFVTFYDSTGVAGNTVYYNRTLPMAGLNASFIHITGTTLYEIVSAIGGVQAVQLVITSLLTPDILWVGLNLPQVPGYLLSISDSTIFNNRYLVDSQAREIKNGWLLNFSTPIPGNVTVSTPITDDFSFVGNASTWIWVNTTAGNVYNSTSLPAGISLSGASYTIWTNRTISAVRDIHFRWQRVFTYQYFPATDVYQTLISFNNTVGVQWRNLTLFIPFQNNSRVDNRSVQVYDMNNTVYLGEGVNYVLSKSGIHMYFAMWNASLWRGFRITYTTVNDSTPVNPATVLVNRLGDGETASMTWQTDSFYYAIAEWTNSYREVYDGPLYITLKLSVSVDPDTIIVLDANNVVVISAIVNGNTVIIPDLHIAVGGKVTFTVLFKSMQRSILDLSYAGIPLFVVAMSVMIGALVLGGAFTLMGTKDGRMRQLGRLCFGLSALAMGLLSMLVMYAIVTTGA